MKPTALPDLVEAAAACVRNMRHAAWVATSCPPALARMASRPALIALDSFIPIAQQAKNKLPASPLRRSLHTRLSDLRRDYQGYAPVRHKLAAHRDVLAVLEAAQVWGTVQYDVVEILAADGTAVITDLSSEAGTIVALDSADVGDAELRGALGQLVVPDGVRIDLSDIALVEGNRVTLIPVHPVQAAVQPVFGALDAFDATLQLHEAARGFAETGRLMASMLVVDACSVHDSLFGRTRATKHIPGYRDVLAEHGHAGARELDEIQRTVDRDLLIRSREVRSTLGAHVDASVKAADRAAALDDIAADELGDLVTSLEQGLQAALAAEFYTDHLRIHGEGMRGIVAALPTDLERPYGP